MPASRSAVRKRKDKSGAATPSQAVTVQGETVNGVGTIIAPVTLLDVVGDSIIETHHDIARADARIFRAAVKGLIEWSEANKAVWLLEQMGRALERHINQRAIESRMHEAFTGIQFVPAKASTDPVEEAYIDNQVVNGGTPE